MGTEAIPDRWAPFRYFLGAWTGIGEGKPGHGELERRYELVLAEKFIHIQTRAVYEPQEQNLKGEVHEDWGLLGYDETRQAYVLREFHVEGFVNQYTLREMSEDGRKLVFVTEAIENIPSGWKARTTYEILGEDAFRETFDLAAPEKSYDCYITSELHRRP